MIEPHFIAQMERWGYLRVPDERPYAPGRHNLLIALREVPTEKHFDPEAIHLRMGDAGDSVNWSTIRLHFPLYGTKKAGLGRVIIRDRVDKRVEFFSYGGEVDATYGRDQAVVVLRSTAPILEITDDLQSFSDQLAFETEAIIATSQAGWHGDDYGFAAKLATLPPAQCYLAAVNTILQRYHRNPRLRDHFRSFYRALLKEQEWMAESGHWSEALPHLDDLLRANHHRQDDLPVA